MRAHKLALELLSLPDQYVYIQSHDRGKSCPCNHIEVRLNGIVLMPETTGEGVQP